MIISTGSRCGSRTTWAPSIPRPAAIVYRLKVRESKEEKADSVEEKKTRSRKRSEMLTYVFLAFRLCPPEIQFLLLHHLESWAHQRHPFFEDFWAHQDGQLMMAVRPKEERRNRSLQGN
jgi:hypothetical protein